MRTGGSWTHLPEGRATMLFSSETDLGEGSFGLGIQMVRQLLLRPFVVLSSKGKLSLLDKKYSKCKTFFFLFLNPREVSSKGGHVSDFLPRNRILILALGCGGSWRCGCGRGQRPGGRTAAARAGAARAGALRAGALQHAARAARLGPQEGALWAPPSVLLSARSAGELSFPPGRVREGI